MREKIMFILVCLFLNILVAQQSKDSLPGDVSLVSTKDELNNLMRQEKNNYKYSVEDYFKTAQQSSFSFSRDGEYLSYFERAADGKKNLCVKNLFTNKIKKIVEEKDEVISDYYWLSNGSLVYLQDHGGDENYNLFSVDVNGENINNWTPFPNVQVDILTILRKEAVVIVLMNKDNPEIFEPYKIDIERGLVTKLFENKDVQNPIVDYYFDKDGKLKAYAKQDKEDLVLFYQKGNALFEKVLKTNSWKDNFSIISFNYETLDNPHDAYVLTNLDSNTNEIVLYDFLQNKIIKKLFSNARYDLKTLKVSEKRGYELDYYSFNGEKQIKVPLSATYKELDKKFKKEFAEKNFYIVSITDKEDKYLILVDSDKIEGKYYMYDALEDKFTELINMAPQLAEEDMADMKAIEFFARDGMILSGYITIPRGASALNKVPLIVNPHGGPYDERDDWGFNSEAQLFASRGYATLQINFRGSGGYGKLLYLAGSKQIGRKMLEDLEDGVNYAKSLGFIENEKIAIYGGSYGGLAALGSLVKTPNLYKCAVSYVGPSNLFSLFESIPAYWKPYVVQMNEQWYNPNDSKDRKVIKEVSPALNTDKIIKPVFVIQGANDPRVNIFESDQIVSNLRKKGLPTPYMVKYNEGHGFAREENQIESYKCMMGFFAQNLK